MGKQKQDALMALYRSPECNINKGLTSTGAADAKNAVCCSTL